MRGIITVLGKDKVGIIARVCAFLAESGINILDISQTIVQEFFNMVMVVDLAGSTKSFDALADGLDEIGRSMSLSIKLQHEDIFNAMHRV